MLKKIFYTILFFLVDVLLWGSVSGLIHVVGYGLGNWINGTDYNLYRLYFVGIFLYFIVSSILSKFQIHYQDACKFLAILNVKDEK